MCTKRRRASDFISSKRRCMWAVPRGRYMLRQQSHHVCTARGDDRVAVPSSIDLATSSKCAPRAHAAMRITAAVDCPPRAGQRTRSASRCRAPTTSSTCSSTARSPWPASCVPSAACRFTASRNASGSRNTNAQGAAMGARLRGPLRDWRRRLSRGGRSAPLPRVRHGVAAAQDGGAPAGPPDASCGTTNAPVSWGGPRWPPPRS